MVMVFLYCYFINAYIHIIWDLHRNLQDSLLYEFHIPRQEEGKELDFLFIDHVKHLYLSDLKLAMELKILAKGCVVVGDNVVFPGAPDYRDYMLSGEGSKFFKTQAMVTAKDHRKTKQYMTIHDTVDSRTRMSNRKSQDQRNRHHQSQKLMLKLLNLQQCWQVHRTHVEYWPDQPDEVLVSTFLG